jgi:multidrug efflux system membrane fusion protein
MSEKRGSSAISGHGSARLLSRKSSGLAWRGAAVLAVLAGLLIEPRGSTLLPVAEAQTAPAPPAVTVSPPLRKEITEWQEFTGQFEAVDYVEIRARVSGYLTKVAFKDGSEVKEGDLLFEIDPRPYEAALAQAEAALARDRAQLENAEADAKRYADLVKKDYVTAQQNDSVKANAQAYAATVRADQAAVDRARLDLGYCTIRSPLDGRTGIVMVQAGNVVKANDATLVTINQVVPVYVAVAVPERDLPEIRRRQAEAPLPVVAEDATTGKALAAGELTFIDNSVDRTTGTITLKATFQNADRVLWPGEFVNAVLTLTTEQRAIVAPTGAVQNGQQGTFAYVVKADGTVESRPVTVARNAADGVVIAKGLSAGEKVVTDGHLRLKNGVKIEIVTGDGTEAKKS